jgi:hypothetical protein
MKHVSEYDLALYATGDLGWWTNPAFRLHVSRCPQCKGRAEEYRQDQQNIRRQANALPAGVNWDRLAAEMTANIRVGLAAGECVAPRGKHRSIPTGWRVAIVSSSFVALLIGAWWLNMPASQTASLERAVKAIASGRSFKSNRMMLFDERGPLVEATAAGVELRDNGIALGVSSEKGLRPVSVSLSVQGTARARYVDTDTGQVTITSVYAQ